MAKTKVIAVAKIRYNKLRKLKRAQKSRIRYNKLRKLKRAQKSRHGLPVSGRMKLPHTF